MRTLDEVDRRIIEVTREMFMQQGLQKTEMKDIAKQVGIGRSTLYRHFVSKEAISFYIAKDILVELQEISVENQITEDMKGYDKLALYLNVMTKAMIRNPNKIRFLDEFDQIFSGVYPDSDEAEEYVSFNYTYKNPALRYYNEGIRDGSIRKEEESSDKMEVILTLLFGLAQRVIPREHHYVQEHSKNSTEYFEESLNILLKPLKNIV
ncbi:TetR/AcrR family transcriptional regulator [Anaerosporobacter sp.]|uniref:TetR/AcrR family transcriptional regulator n=1 Tax=Anaerosporobacter sp. TaxID=1872529 RepID=UPI00286F21D6|nr:TetR/AcrR family transcriptional regulator [Anaerosporobacter sp.]